MFAKTHSTNNKPLTMKSSRSSIQVKTHACPTLHFEDQKLTSYSGLIVYQLLFDRLDVKKRLRGCFRHLTVNPVFGHSRIVLLLIIHMLLGYRELRQVRYYADDPIVLRFMGLTRLPDVATISRTLSDMDDRGVEQVQGLLSEMVLNRLDELQLKRITLDFDGSVIGTNRFAEGSAVGFNKKKKGQRSYYPLFCTVAQTSQVLDVLHRSGNVHDANGARQFILECIEKVRETMQNVTIEVRMDSAFFSDEIVHALDKAKIEYTISVPFERFMQLKEKIEGRHTWYPMNASGDYFEQRWKPKSWNKRHRFIFVRQQSKIQYKGPVQMDMFIPYQYGFDFKVVLTNKRLRAAGVVAYHNGRGSQEGIFAELKTHNQLDYIPTRTWNGNRIYLLSTLFAHNVTRELQMVSTAATRQTQSKRPALWCFQQLGTIRRGIIQRAGRLIRPNGKMTLSMSANEAQKETLLHYVNALSQAA
jgi:hypothetical protein